MSGMLMLGLLLMPTVPLYAVDGEDVSVETGDASSSAESTTVVHTTEVDAEPEVSETEEVDTPDETDAAEEEHIEQEENEEDREPNEEEARDTDSGEDGERDDTEEKTHQSDSQDTENNTDDTPHMEMSSSTEEMASSTPETESLANQQARSTPDAETSTSTASTTASTTLNTTIDTESEANVDTHASTSAETGHNTAHASAESAIETGHAESDVNVLNITNTNVIDSYGFMLLMNHFMDDAGTIDVRSLIQPLKVNTFAESGGDGCGTGLCGGSGTTTISNTSTSTVGNSVVARSSTGGNTATGSSASIETGDAYAGANVVNIANSNVVDANYMLLSVNNFGDWAGDLVLPGKDFFMDMLYGMGTTGSGGGVTVDTGNKASVTTDVSVAADTGHNTATSTEESSIETGDAVASANVVNSVNNNFFDQDSLYILFRVHGDWNGNVFGLPPGLSWRATGGGVEIFGSSDASQGDESTTTQAQADNLSISSDNQADITNNIDVYALTGDNQASGTEHSSVSTGNAYAGANVVNMANTNIIGRNWILAIVNIFGDWNGNLAFGRPDLWLGARLVPVNPMKPIGPGSELEFQMTVVNRGDSDATDVELTNHFDIPFIEFLDRGMPFTTESLRMTSWNIGTVPAGEYVEFTIPAKVKGNIVSGTTRVKSTMEVRAFETDADTGDNMEKLSVMIENPHDTQRVHMDEEDDDTSLPPAFTITKVGSSTTTVASSSVDYEITIHNEGGLSPDTVVVDTLRNESGDILSEQVWELGPVYADEEITITYTSEFSSSTVPGLYTNTADVHSNVGDTIMSTSTEFSVMIEVLPEVEEPAIEELREPVREPVAVGEADEPDVYGITLLPPMCTAYGCYYDRVPATDTDRNPLFASALGSGFDIDFGFGGDGEKPLRFLLLAAMMYAVYHRGGHNMKGKALMMF